MKILRPPLFMRPDPEAELEQVIDRELHRLPDLQAPPDLLPSVLRLVAERQSRPWWRKSFVHWPGIARGLFLAATTGLAGLALYFTWGVGSGLSVAALSGEIAPYVARFELARTLLVSLGGALLTVAKSAGPWLPWTAAGIVGISYLTTVTLGTYCYRLAAERV